MGLPPMEWIEKIIQIDSTTYRSNDELIRFLAPLLEDSGLKVEEQKISENGQIFKNLIAYNHSPDAPDLFLMNTHLDTASGGDSESWTKTNGNPFRLTRVRDRLYGLGTADVKIDFLCKLWAARIARPWKVPFALVGTFGEERGLVGAAELLKAKRVKPRYVLVGEPSGLALIYAHKGHLIFSFSFARKKISIASVQTRLWKGKSAHSSTPHLGTNAVRKALTDIFKRDFGIISMETGTDTNRVPDYCKISFTKESSEITRRIFHLLRLLDEWQSELKVRKDTRFSPSFATLSLNRAVTSPAAIELTFDLRCLPDMNSKKILEKLNVIAKQSHATFQLISCEEPLKGQKNGRLMQIAADALKQCGVKVQRQTKASSTEAALYQQSGAEAIAFGPGISVGNVHRPNEYNSLKQIDIATRFYATMLRTQCGKNQS